MLTLLGFVLGIVATALAIEVFFNWLDRRDKMRYLRSIDSPFAYENREDFDAAIRRRWSPEERKLLGFDDDGYPIEEKQSET